MSNQPQRGRSPQYHLGRFEQRVLTLMIPGDLREAAIGDLLEELNRFVAPERGPSHAQLWLWRQILGSLLPFLWLRCRMEAPMMKRKFIAAGLMIGVGSLQAWDSRVFESPPLTITLVLAALAIAAVTTLAAGRYPALLVALVLASAILLVVRIASPSPLRGDLLTILPVLWVASLLAFPPFKLSTRPQT